MREALARTLPPDAERAPQGCAREALADEESHRIQQKILTESSKTVILREAPREFFLSLES
jgi:phosphoribosyl-ATP pyrophosphohydrolase